MAFIVLGLPQPGGRELARFLLLVKTESSGIKTRLVALSGYSGRETRESTGAGFDAYVVKPIWHVDGSSTAEGDQPVTPDSVHIQEAR